MELGYDAILLNTAVAKAGDPVRMAQAFARAIEAGHQAFQAQPIEARDMAAPSTPVMASTVKLDPFYPIFDRAEWLIRLLPLGIKLVQLRVKDQPPEVIRAEIRAAKGLCAEHGCTLV
eukprot:gene41290-55848_t